MTQESQGDTAKHVAIIMDGNYRWAKKQAMPFKNGHKKGADNIETIVKASIDRGVKYLTLYAFSSENWDRPKEEVDYLMDLLDDYLTNDINKILKHNVKILISGDLERLKDKSKKKIDKIIEKTKDNDVLTVNIAFSYGSRQELTSAVNKLFLAVKDKTSNIEYEDIQKYFYQPNLPDPDLLIRTGGDKRISNFLLLQMAYTEFYFTDILWPDFSKKDLDEALNDFNQRVRKYGKR